MNSDHLEESDDVNSTTTSDKRQMSFVDLIDSTSDSEPPISPPGIIPSTSHQNVSSSLKRSNSIIEIHDSESEDCPNMEQLGNYPKKFKYSDDACSSSSSLKDRKQKQRERREAFFNTLTESDEDDYYYGYDAESKIKSNMDENEVVEVIDDESEKNETTSEESEDDNKCDENDSKIIQVNSIHSITGYHKETMEQSNNDKKEFNIKINSKFLENDLINELCKYKLSNDEEEKKIVEEIEARKKNILKKNVENNLLEIDANKLKNGKNKLVEKTNKIEEETNQTEGDKSETNNIAIKDKIEDNNLENNGKETDKIDIKLSDNVKLINDPFRVYVFNDFIEDANCPKVLYDILESGEISWEKKRMDLFEFFQTKDLTDVGSDQLKKVYEFLKDDVMPWVSQITGMKLNKITASCSCYTFSDYLLIHDDLSADKRVAFVWYLTGTKDGQELWSENFGGNLELFSSDPNTEQPSEVKHQIVPKNNQLILFPVDKHSYHQVTSIKSMDYPRFSINGWFHLKDYKITDLVSNVKDIDGLFGTNNYKPFDEKTIKPAGVDDIMLPEYISHLYFETENQLNIVKYFEQNSEMRLENFFHTLKYQRICDKLKNDNIKWEFVGPLLTRHYEVAVESTLPKELKSFVNLFKSSEMFQLLTSYTNLELCTKQASLRYELQRWTPGCYSLMSEANWYKEKELDLIIHFNLNRPYQDELTFGKCLYVSRIGDEGDDYSSSANTEALITILPRYNTVNMVYREEETARIVPLISPNTKVNKIFYTLVCSYKE